MSAQVEPRNFSWFVDKKIAGMAWPSAESFPFLAENGISVLINLTETNPPAYHSIATSHNIRCIHCNIKAYGTPSLEQIEEILTVIIEETEENGHRVGIHCVMGQGRTGTLLASYLMKKEGLTAVEAIDETRRRRNRSIETKEQEETLKAYEHYKNE